MIKKLTIKPSFLKNEKGKTTEVYLDLKTYKTILKQIETFDKIKKKDGVKWVQVSKEKTTKLRNKKSK